MHPFSRCEGRDALAAARINSLPIQYLNPGVNHHTGFMSFWAATISLSSFSADKTGFWEMNVGALSEFVDFLQPTTQPTRTYVLHDFRVVWQSLRSCKF